MKKMILLVFFSSCLFFFCVMPLASQTYREASIYIPPIAGIGNLGENTFFYRLLTYEVTVQNHSVVRNQAGSDFTLLGFIDTYNEFKIYNEAAAVKRQLNNSRIPVPPVYDPSQDISAEHENDYVFNIQLIDSRTGEIIGEQHIIYTTIDSSVNSLISILIYNLFSCLPDYVDKVDHRDNYLYIDASVLWTPRLYNAQSPIFNWLNVGFGLSLEYHFFKYLALGLGFNFSQDWLVVNNINYHDLILEVPLSLSYVMKPDNHLMLGPYAGIAANFSMTQATHVSPFSWFAGFQLGIIAGPGLITIDPRFSMDIFPSSVRGTTQQYRRYLIQIGFGYKLGFLPKNVRDY